MHVLKDAGLNMKTVSKLGFISELTRRRESTKAQMKGQG